MLGLIDARFHGCLVYYLRWLSSPQLVRSPSRLRPSGGQTVHGSTSSPRTGRVHYERIGLSTNGMNSPRRSGIRSPNQERGYQGFWGNAAFVMSGRGNAWGTRAKVMAPRSRGPALLICIAPLCVAIFRVRATETKSVGPGRAWPVPGH
jgi:hypothetical protein